MSSNDLSGFNEFANNGANALPGRTPSAAYRLEKYRKELAEMSLTSEQETEILRILWAMMGYFARMGQTVDVCGLFLSDVNQASDSDSARGILKPSPNEETPSKRGGKETK